MLMAVNPYGMHCAHFCIVTLFLLKDSGLPLMH